MEKKKIDKYTMYEFICTSWLNNLRSIHPTLIANFNFLSLNTNTTRWVAIQKIHGMNNFMSVIKLFKKCQKTNQSNDFARPQLFYGHQITEEFCFVRQTFL